MNKTFILLLLLTAVLCHNNQAHHTCHHDEISDSIRNEAETIDIEEHTRNMAAVPPRKMIITYDMSYLNSLAVTPANTTFKLNAEKALKIAIQFFNDLITIVPKTGNMKWTNTSTTCGLATIPAADKTTDKVSDLHLYVTYTVEPTASFLAYAGWCRLLFVVGPTHGQVNFNLAKLASYNFADPVQFQMLVSVIKHEIIHVLGFSGNDIKYWVNPTTKVAYTAPTSKGVIRGLTSTLLSTPNVLAFARAYYGCPTLAGMPLENQGSSGSLGSHWEMTDVHNEAMESQVNLTKNLVTGFTAALLRDTGFYATINAAMEEQIFFGKGKGCTFTTGACSTTGSEFCAAGVAGAPVNQCDFNAEGVSYCGSGTFFDAGCNLQQVYSNANCQQGVGNFLNSAGFVTYVGVTFGPSSKCFVSSISSPLIGAQGLCYTSVCSADKLSITITVASGKTAVCSVNGATVSVAGLPGTLKCPSNILAVCSQSKTCPNNCSSNGYCINGVCKCIAGTGPSCA